MATMSRPRSALALSRQKAGDVARPVEQHPAELADEHRWRRNGLTAGDGERQFGKGPPGRSRGVGRLLNGLGSVVRRAHRHGLLLRRAHRHGLLLRRTHGHGLLSGVPIDMDSSCGMFAPSVWFPACSFGIQGYLQIRASRRRPVSFWPKLASPARSTQVTSCALTKTMRTLPQVRQRTTVPGARR